MRIKLGVPMTLSDISNACNGKLPSNSSKVIKYITTDSREAEEGDLFIALRGERFNGEEYVDSVKEKGGFVLSANAKIADVDVPNTSAALLDLAHNYNKNLPYLLYNIGITGSVGKTTTKEFLKVLLSTGYNTHANEGNMNNEIGLPLSVLRAPKETEICIMEMGMNHLGEISRLSKCLRPDIGIITNIGTSHIGNLGSRENIAKAKLEISDGMSGGRIIIPADEPLLSRIKNKAVFSLNKKGDDFYLLSPSDYIVEIYHSGKLFCRSEFAFSEIHLKKCLLAAASAAILCDISPSLLKRGISSISKNNIRQRLITVNNRHFYADYYNASPESITAAIEAIRNVNPEGRKSLLLGDVMELGNKSEELHLEIGRNIPRELFYNLFLFGKDSEYIFEGAREAGFPVRRIYRNPDTSRPDITADQIINNTIPGETILMKASRGIKLERILELIKPKS